MHDLIDEKMVDTIRKTGKTDQNLPDRVPILEANGLPYDQEADNVVVTGCQILGALPQVLASLSRTLGRAGLSHTFLSTEYCCGNNVYRPAIKARDEQALAECRQLSKEFVALNLEAAEKLKARRLIVFCSPCYPIYKHAFPEADIIFYPQALDEVLDEIEFNGEVDYYAGCYKLHKRFSPAPMDLKSTNHVLAKLKGLKVNRISAPECCYKPDGLAHMLGGIKSEAMVHICTGCYFQALINLPPDKKETRILMLPELVEAALRK